MAPVPAPPPGCPDTVSLLASMSPRDKLAQLLMVGVTGAADARTTVATQHVGGIFIGNFTDLSMLKDGTLAEIAGSAGPLGLRGRRRRGGWPRTAVVIADGARTVGPGARTGPARARLPARGVQPRPADARFRYHH